MQNIVVWLVLLVVLVSCSQDGGSKGQRANENKKELKHDLKHPPVKVAIIGDQAVNQASKDLLKLIKHEDAEILLINGDLGYEKDPTKWKNMNLEILGKDFPIVAVAGNHDVEVWQSYQKILGDWNANAQLKCEGKAGEKNVCRYKGIKFVTVVPGIYPDRPVAEDEAFIKDSFSEDEGDWRICAWHKTMYEMQTYSLKGRKINETGWGVYEACRESGALITTGHTHAYSRSYLFSDIPNQKIATYSADMTLKKGETLVAVSGLGGKGAYPLLHDNPWWAAKANKDTGIKAGALFCTFNEGDDAKKASCYFKDLQGNILDEFRLYNGR